MYPHLFDVALDGITVEHVALRTSHVGHPCLAPPLERGHARLLHAISQFCLPPNCIQSAIIADEF